MNTLEFILAIKSKTLYAYLLFMLDSYTYVVYVG